MSPLDIQRILTQPGSYLILDPDFKIVAVSAEYLRLTAVDESQLIGKVILDVLPYSQNRRDKDSGASVKASLERVRATKSADKMVRLPFHFRWANEEMQTRYLTISHTPILSGGELKFIIHRIQDETLMKHMESEINSLRLRLNIGFVVICLTVALIVYVGFSDQTGRETIQHKTCVIQARGLPAGHHLAKGLGDVVKFLKVILPPGAHLNKYQQQLLTGIEGNLSYYSRIEAKQPSSRKC